MVLFISITIIVLAVLLIFHKKRGTQKRNSALRSDKETGLRQQEQAGRFSKETAEKDIMEKHYQQTKANNADFQEPVPNTSSTIRDAAALAAGAALINHLRKEHKETDKSDIDSDAGLSDLWEDEHEELEDMLDQYEDEQFYASLDESDDTYIDDYYDDTAFIEPDVDDIEYYDD